MFGKDFLANEEHCKQQIGVVLGGIDFYKHKKLFKSRTLRNAFTRNGTRKRISVI